jgi:hypothetical protein
MFSQPELPPLLTQPSSAARAAAGLQLTMAGYIIWRALRTLNPGWSYFISVPIWLCEFAGFTLSNAFVLSLWNQIHRPPRKLGQMLSLEDMPAVDVYVPTYSGEYLQRSVCYGMLCYVTLCRASPGFVSAQAWDTLC